MSVKNAIHQKIMKLVTPHLSVPKNSTLLKNGKITPEEFVAAGDSLISLCPSWTWQKSPDPKKAVKYLPEDKQYLINRHLVCQDRAQDFSAVVADEKDLPDFDGWCQTGEESKAKEVDLDQEKEVDLDDIDLDNVKPLSDDEDDGKDTTAGVRTYDITIVYDNYYNVAHVFLYGMNENGTPLTLKEMLQDISADHAEKTVTYEDHPFLNQKALSIHPCQHHNVMLKLIERLDHPESFSAPGYFFLFLNFIHTVIPTIDVGVPSIEFDGNTT